MPTVGPWVCDTCSEEIVLDEGYVVWDSDGEFETLDFRIIHQGRCDDRKSPSSMPLDEFVGVDGLNLLLSFLSAGPLLLDGDLSGSSGRVASTDSFVDFVRRVQIPGYEQVRHRYTDSDVRDALEGVGESGPYRQKTIQKIITGNL